MTKQALKAGKKPVSPSPENEHRLAGIIASATDAIIIIDDEETITIFNAAAERMFGCGADDALGEKLDRFIPARFRGKRSKEKSFAVPKASKTSASGLTVITGLRASGEEFPLEASISHSESGGKMAFTIILRDISDRQRVQDLVRIQSEKLLQQNRMLDHAPVLVRNLQNGIIFWNRGAEEMYGFTAQEALGRRSHDLLRTQFPEPLCDIEATLAERGEWSGELIHYRSDKSRVVVLSRWVRHEEGPGGGCIVEVNSEITLHKQAEEIVQRFAAIIKNTDDAIISKTLDGAITGWNPAAAKMFGYTEAEAIGQPITMLFPPERYFEEAEVLAKISRGELVHHYETVRIRKDGVRLDVSVTISPLRDASGKIIGASKILRDVTEEKRSQQQLKLLSTCIATINDIIIVTDAGSANGAAPRAVFVNDAVERVLGYAQSEILGRDPRMCQMEKTDPHVLDEIREAQDQHKPVRRQVVSCAKDGVEYGMDLDISPIFDAAGRCTHFVEIQRDITELSRFMHRIEEQAELLDKAQDGILVRDLEGNILFWNKGAERMYGWLAEEAIGCNVGELIYADTAKFQEANTIAIEKGEWSGELRHITKKRTELIIEARWSLVRDKQGRPKSVLAINTDVTEKRKIESQFMRAQRMESIGILAGGIAHDLNNILAPIILSLDMLKATARDQETRLILETIEISARRGADIVQQVLSFARGMEGRRIEIQSKYLLRDLQHIIKDTFPKDIRLKMVLPDEIWTILGDPTQIHQILLNLCVNARDAMPKGGNLTVSAQNEVLDEQYLAMNMQAKPGPYVVLSVMDSGTGIPADILDKIFEPFFTTKEVGKGTGLGLSTVVAIAKSHDGFVNVYSEIGRGTTFKVYIPAETLSSPTHDEPAVAEILPRGNGETILIVDDEPAILTITGQTLQAFGYRVLKASNGAEAVAVYAQHMNEISVVLTDMAMPVMDGTTTIYALRKINPELKIVAASGLYADGGVVKASTAGVEHFILKPYTAAVLLNTLKEVLKPLALG